ncbi:MAG: hypothetical protein IKB73_00125 [Ruminococcus sp.]|nr:hypothetical protein [Ruminococcus sp.]
MDDISSKLNEILSDPAALSKIKGLGDMLGLTQNTEQPKSENNTKNSTDMLSSLLSYSKDDTLSMVTKFAPLLSNISKEDDTSRLLFALRPFLSDTRKQKLDEASKIIKMMKLLPLIKDFGILDSLF